MAATARNREWSLNLWRTRSLEWWQWSLLPPHQQTADATFGPEAIAAATTGSHWTKTLSAYKAQVRADLGWPATFDWLSPEAHAGRSRYSWAVAEILDC